MSTKLHSRLSSQSNQVVNGVKSKSLGKETFNTLTMERKTPKPKYIVGDKGSGENTLHEIQAIIVS